MAGTVTTTPLTWNYAPNDVVYFIKECEDLISSSIVQGTIYRVEVVETTVGTATVRYILRTEYASAEVIDDEANMFGVPVYATNALAKAAALAALDTLLP